MALNISEIIKVLEKIAKDSEKSSKEKSIKNLLSKEESVKLLEYSKKIWYFYLGK